jgi:O-6-methylguanine DNA methyltransferase
MVHWQVSNKCTSFAREIKMLANVGTKMISAQTIYWTSVPSAIGECVLMATERGLCWLGTPGTPRTHGEQWVRKIYPDACVTNSTHAVLQQAAQELERYFAGEHIAFTCPLDLHGTPFQRAVWQALCTIPYGETRSYADIARMIGRPTACRAVGAANGANPVAIIVPCHRVIGSSGDLTGYGGGLDTKAWLLQLEGITPYAHQRR